jgi:DNA-binding transcriptional LysR family regulator
MPRGVRKSGAIREAKCSPTAVRASRRRSDDAVAKSVYEKLDRVDWRDLELFLDVAEAGSIRAGALKARHAISTVRKRLARIEDSLGELIARREPNGLLLTDTGIVLLRIAREMRRSREMVTSEGEFCGDRNVLRIAVTEGLGTYWLMPRLVEFQEANSDLQVELICDMQRVDIIGGDFDIAVQLEATAETRALSLRIGTLHLMPFASDRYLRTAGTPKSVDDWPNHRLVWQEADQVASHLLPYFVGTAAPGKLIGITTNSSSAHFRAIATGGGIGILPTYARAVSRRVRPIDIGIQLKREILCVINPAKANLSEVTRAVAWLRDAFCGETYPWFRDEFVHPRDFEEAISKKNVISLFEGFIDGLEVDEG